MSLPRIIGIFNSSCPAGKSNRTGKSNSLTASKIISLMFFPKGVVFYL